jgi:Mrp family chromosome partitioning ATPase
VRVLAEIPARPPSGLRTGTLRRTDLEAYGSLLEQLRPAHSVLVTGEAPDRREAAAGLAAVATAAGTRTVLLECELGEPGLAEALGLAIAPGLHEYLRGTADSEAILTPVVLAGPGSAGASEPLVCIVAGRPAHEGWALLASDRFRAAVEGLRESYELVVIDGPALHDESALGVVFGLVDATIACVAATDARRKLPVPVTGVVIQR